jgi:mycothiol synthase
VISALIEAATAADGVRPVSEATELALRSGATPLTAQRAGELAGFAYTEGGSAEVVVAPAWRRQGVGSELLAALAPERVWAHGRLPAAEAFAARHGYVVDRVLWQLRRPAVDIPEMPLPQGISLRSFVVGRDEEDWLRVNSRAFADHPDQGSWTLADLVARENEPWFDPAGFLLAIKDDCLIGFHWTKIHPDGIGEVYVLGLDPAAQGSGLAKPLTIAGLRSLADRGVGEIMLYVDESNTAAMHLYRRLGFQDYRADVQFVPGTASPTQ